MLAGRPGFDAVAQGPGLPTRAFDPGQVMQVIGAINASNGAPQSHTSVVMHQGYMVEIYSEETIRPRAGIAVFDISDPASPLLVARTEEDTGLLSEQHAIAFTSQGGRDYAAHLAVDGIQIWDWTDVRDPHPVGHLVLPGIFPGYANGAWWLTWQPPYLYVSGASNGIYIVNTADPTAPRLVDRGGEPNPLPTSQTGGFRVGPVFAVGNLLVVTSNDGPGYATLDISDPENPTLLDALVTNRTASYSSMVNGYRIYAAGSAHDDFLGFDIRDPHRIVPLDSVPMDGRGGYLTIQDHFAHVGASDHYVKVDIQDDNYRVVGTATSGVPNHDEDFAVVLGNLVVLSDDHYNGSFIFPHQAEPDTTGPQVNMVFPLDGAAGQSRSSRIGLTFTDLIDLRTVNASTFIVRPEDGPPLEGTYSTQTGIVNFTPASPLAPNTTYEIIVPAGGIKDLAGNPVPVTFTARFTTGETGGSPLFCQVKSAGMAEVGTSAHLTVRLLEGGGDVRYTWNFGDGSPPLVGVRDTTVAHVYSAPGHYTVRVTADDGRHTARCATLQTAYNPLQPGHAPSSSTIILDRSATQVWNVNPDNDSVTAINAVTLAKMFEAPVGHQPRTLAQAPDGSIWVVNQGDDTISVLDANTGASLGTIPLPPGSRPYGIVFHPDRHSAFVSLYATGRIARLDVQARSLAAQVDVGPTPRGLALSHDGSRLFVTRYISPDTHGEVVEVDPQTFQVVRRLALALDPGPDTDNSGRGLPNALGAPAISPDGRRLWIPARKANIQRGQSRDGLPLTFDTTVRAMAAQVDLQTNQEDLAARHDFNNREGPVAVGFSPLGDYAFVVLQGSNAIDVLDVYTNQLITAIEPAGQAPQGLAFTAEGGKLFVHSWLSRSVLVYDVSEILQPGLQEARLLAEIPTVAQERLDPQVLAGKRIFYNARDSRMSRDGYMACASCHLDGGDDGRVYDRLADGEGLRNTISLLGLGRELSREPLGRGRLHWTGNFDEVQDFEHDMRSLFGGRGFLADANFSAGTRSDPLGDTKAGLSPELDALAAYVASLTELPPSPFRNPDGTLTPEGQAGRRIFTQLGCPLCHGGPDFSDSATGVSHDVGTLKPTSGMRAGQPLLGLDTPTLRGLWLTAPYLHDGSAATLRDVLTTQNPAGLHGETATLSPEALDQLISFLLQIDDREPGFPVTPQGLSPAIELVSPVADAVFRPGQRVPMAANTSNQLGPAAKVEFYADGQLLGEKTAPVYTWEWVDPPPGMHFVTARLVYANGAKTTADPVRIYVVP